MEQRCCWEAVSHCVSSVLGENVTFLTLSLVQDTGAESLFTLKGKYSVERGIRSSWRVQKMKESRYSSEWSFCISAISHVTQMSSPLRLCSPLCFRHPTWDFGPWRLGEHMLGAPMHMPELCACCTSVQTPIGWILQPMRGWMGTLLSPPTSQVSNCHNKARLELNSPSGECVLTKLYYLLLL